MNLRSGRNILFLLNIFITGLLFSQTSQQFKRIDYEYDLVSGNVNKVSYEAGRQDQLMHKYEYDADNRITKAYTSTDGVNWDCDATYTYYHHGPLGRTELGDKKVQGIDYAYTLHGWLKGINSTVLDPSKDIGKDGAASGANTKVARDIFSYSLGYFTNDYKPIVPASTSFLATTTSSPLDAPNSSLYDGNIRHMAVSLTNPIDGTSLPIQGNVYKYDQLNRLVNTKQHHLSSPATNSWVGAPLSTNYNENFVYDANGNIETLTRNGVSTAMDNLSYKYKQVDGQKINNKLLHVNDVIGDDSYNTDVDNQGVYVENDPSNWNYGYDAIGNLIKDKQEKIANITWTPAGKIKEIFRTPGFGKPNLEFKYNSSGQRVAKIMKPDGQLGDPTKWITTFYIHDAKGNVMAIYEKQYNNGTAKYDYTLQEQYLYAGKRIGSINRNELMLPVVYSIPVNFPHTLGRKQYELSNHLGNVLSTISDRKIAVDNNGDKVVEYYKANVLSTTDYYAFGSPMPARDFNPDNYRFGFNGKENDKESIGTGHGTQDYGMRIYNPSLGRFLSVDPLFNKNSHLSSYQYANNSPIFYVDYNGMDYLSWNRASKLGWGVFNLTTGVVGTVVTAYAMGQTLGTTAPVLGPMLVLSVGEATIGMTQVVHALTVDDAKLDSKVHDVSNLPGLVASGTNSEHVELIDGIGGTLSGNPVRSITEAGLNLAGTAITSGFKNQKKYLAKETIQLADGVVDLTQAASGVRTTGIKALTEYSEQREQSVPIEMPDPNASANPEPLKAYIGLNYKANGKWKVDPDPLPSTEDEECKCSNPR